MGSHSTEKGNDTKTLGFSPPSSSPLRMGLFFTVFAGSIISLMQPKDREIAPTHETVVAMVPAGQLPVAQIGLGMALAFDFNGFGQASMLTTGHVLGMAAGAKIALGTASLAAAIAAPIVLPVAGAL